MEDEATLKTFAIGMKICKRYGLLVYPYLFFVLILQGCGTIASVLPYPSIDSLRNGDIVFRKGGSAANVFLSAADSRGIYTHTGLLVIKDGEAMVVHSVPDEAAPGDYDRVKFEPLSEFYRGIKAFSGGVYRVGSLSSEQLQQVTDEAVRWYEKGVPFDSGYVLGDTTELYCTELLMVSFQRVGYDITAGNYTDLNSAIFVGKFIFPSDLLENGDLRAVSVF